MFIKRREVKMEIKNYLESEVLRLTEDLIRKDKDMCQCEKCKADVAAYALNHLQPKYVVSDEGHIFTEVEMSSDQEKAEIISVILEGIKLIKNNPRH
ncbi:MAG TPA: competence protein ComFB [Firmicutes bacterium]|uniref:Competence protein ComFB n=1 Tax=candidate division TA06 bacterium TaxID=2250710 RepID=A0A660SB15_UNCT6|nr:MAG: competence protein ComFB [candidate division TA06 bacterium]HFD05024.1 competence protein ComFB [Bacillota bacterium]